MTYPYVYLFGMTLEVTCTVNEFGKTDVHCVLGSIPLTLLTLDLNVETVGFDQIKVQIESFVIGQVQEGLRYIQ